MAVSSACNCDAKGPMFESRTLTPFLGQKVETGASCERIEKKGFEVCDTTLACV